MCEYAFGWNPGFDQWLFPEPAGAVGTSHPGRMAPDTALCFVLLVAGLETARRSRRRTGSFIVSTILGSLMTTVALVEILSYFTPALRTYGWGGLTMMALPTATLFAVLGAALALTAWQESMAESASSAKPVEGSGLRHGLAFLLVFLLLAAGIIATGIFYYRHYERNYHSEVERQLSAIADLKVNELVQWRKERLGDADILFKNPCVTALVRRFLEKPEVADARQQLQTWLETFKTRYESDQVRLLDAQGVTRLALPAKVTPSPSAIVQGALETLRSGQVILQDFHRNEHNQHIYLAVMIPILDETDGHRPLGVIVLRIDPDTYLYPFIQRWPTPSATAETLLVRREGNNALFLNDLRFRTNAALNLRAPLDRVNMPAVQAVLKREGVFEGVDYRGVPVVSVLRAVPDSPWHIVARMDSAEVYAPLRAQLWQVVVMIGILIFGAGACVVLVWWHQRSRFYREQYQLAEAMRASELRYRRLFEAARDGVLILDAETGMVVDVNPFMVEMLGYSREAFLGKKVWELGFLKNIVVNEANFAELQEKKYIRYEDMALEGRDGKRHEVEFVSNVYLVNGEKVIQCNIRDISKRKKAETALRASEERFRLVSDTANDAIISADSDGRVVYWNRAAQKMFGYSAEEIIGQPLGVLMPERFRQRHAEGLRRFLDGGESRVIGRTVELVAGRKDRTEFPIQLSLANWQMDGRQFFTGFIRDITEREAHEREIKRLNRLYEALSQINQTVTHARERERFMTDVCEVAVKLGGLKTAWIAWIDPTACAFVSMASAGDEQEILQHLKVLVEGDQPEQHPVADCIREGRPYVLNNIETATPPVAWRDKAKQSGTLALAAFPIGSNGSSEGALVVHSSEVGFFGDKEVTLLVEAAADISFGLKHLKHDQQRQESEERYRLLADHAEDFVALHDAHGNRLYVSPSYYRVTGWTPEEIRQIHWRERLHPEDVSIVERARSANLEGQSTIIEHRVRCKQGGWIWVEARCKPILGADGKVERMVVWSRDITDRKLAWEEIRRLNETLEQRVTDRTAELETANKELEAFSYSVSHDLRAPLRGISGYVGMLVEDHAKQLDAEGQRLLGVVSTEACRMGQLIDDLLEFARLGQQAMQSAEIDMGALAQKAFDECAAVAPERQIKLMLHPLPAAWGDAAMIPHVWGNLISNAVKYTRPRAAAEIEITGRADTGEVVYCVKDNGVGFDMKYAGKLFGVFQRLHSDADFEGTGVGLALVQRVVHRHGGRVWAESTLGEGAAFYFTLPDSAKVGS